MSASLKNIVVLAGSGNAGPDIIKELLDAGLTVTATTRPDSSATFAPGVKVAKTDYSKDSLASVFKGQDAVLSLAGSGQIADQSTYVDAAAQAGVKRFFPSEFGGDTRNPVLTKGLPLFEQKRQVVEHLKTKEASGLSWTVIVSGPFFDWGLRAGFTGLDLKNKTANIMDGGDSPVTFSSLSLIGKTIATILKDPKAGEATKNQYIGTETVTISQRDLLAAVEAESGSKFAVTELKSVEERKKGQEQLQQGNHFGYVTLLISYVYGKTDGVDTDLRKTDFGIWNDKLGLPKEDWKQIVKTVVAEY